MAPVYPPVDGSLKSVIDFVDFNAKHNAKSPWLVFPSAHSPDSLTSISFEEMAAASHRAAHFLRPGREGLDNHIVVLLIHTDVPHYLAMIMGIMRAGWVPYPVSPRNSVDAVCNILHTTSCRRIVFNTFTHELISGVRSRLAADGVDVDFKDLPSAKDIFPGLSSPHSLTTSTVSPYPSSPLPDDPGRVVLYLHSSGSTGLPKSIPFMSVQLMEWFKGPWLRGFRTVRWSLVGLPTFHLMGLSWQLLSPLCNVHRVAIYTPQNTAPPTVPNSQTVYEVAKLSGCTGIMTVPSFIEVWSHAPEVVDYLKTLQILIFAGGPLSSSVGDELVSKGVTLASVYGGTEIANPTTPPLLSHPNPNWNWIRFSSEVEKLEWLPQGDGTYELVVHETPDHHLSAWTGMHPKVYATRDLFVPHPTEQDLWKVVSRKDDVIVLSNGEKFVPIPQEGHLNGSHLVAGVVMFGRGHEQPGVLIEPHSSRLIDAEDQVALAQFRNDIWPIVEAANTEAPQFARIFKEMMIVTSRDKPLPRAGKGTVMRSQALDLYSREIADLYQTVQDIQESGEALLPQSWNAEDIQPWLLEHARLVMSRLDIDTSISLFEQGLDSLSATFFRNRIVGALRSYAKLSSRPPAYSTLILPNFVFEYPSVEELTRALVHLLDLSGSTDKQGSRLGPSTEDITAMIQKCCAVLPESPSRVHASSESNVVVLMTGSTGNIGSHILASALGDRRISRIYTLHRKDARLRPDERLLDAFSKRGLPVGLLDDSRLVCAVGDVVHPTLGLESTQYSEVMKTVTHIVHNAWNVNFNLPLRAFEDHLTGVRRLVELCASTERPVKLLVASSIGVASQWDPCSGSVPEQTLEDPVVATSNGYTASKYVTEKILEAASRSGIDATAVRIGQACGPGTTGAWGTNEWFPIMVKSSITIGCFPAMEGHVAWVPLDTIGEIYVEWMFSPSALPPLLNLVHPKQTSWDVVIKGIMQGLGKPLPVVPFDKWIRQLGKLSANASKEELSSIPALQIIDSFAPIGGISSDKNNLPKRASTAPTFETSHLIASSSVAYRMQPISEEHGTMWVKYWKNMGFIA